jgi:hypothetical protein
VEPAPLAGEAGRGRSAGKIADADYRLRNESDFDIWILGFVRISSFGFRHLRCR